MNNDPYGTRADMMRTQLVDLPTDLLEKVFAYMRLDRSNSAAKRIQKVWRRVRFYYSNLNFNNVTGVTSRFPPYKQPRGALGRQRDRRWYILHGGTQNQLY
jgi:hypothetical protein